jgi:adenosylcobinamide-GDP ribazoletransferase
VIPLALRAGLRHLTVVPLRYDHGEATLAPARTLAWFPLVGLLIAVPVWAVLLLPIPVLPRAVVALIVWTGLTGNLHEDGLCDVADAVWAPVSQERRLEILRDPRVGAHAVSAAVLMTLMRFSLLSIVPPYAVLFAVPTGRFMMVLALSQFRPARTGGLGAQFARGARAEWAALWLAAIAVGLASVFGWQFVLSAAAGLAAGMVGAWYAARRLGGVTGDVCGAAGLITETVVLAAIAFDA